MAARPGRPCSIPHRSACCSRRSSRSRTTTAGSSAFGPDGRLWLGLGDGGSGGDPLGNGQDPFALLGKILRLDVDAEPTARPRVRDPRRQPVRGRRPGSAGGVPDRPAQPVALQLRSRQRRAMDRRRRAERARGGQPGGPGGIGRREPRLEHHGGHQLLRSRRVLVRRAGAAGRAVRPRPRLLGHGRLRLPRDGRRRPRRLVPVQRLLQRPAVRRSLRPRATPGRGTRPPARTPCSRAA